MGATCDGAGQGGSNSGSGGNGSGGSGSGSGGDAGESSGSGGSDASGGTGSSSGGSAGAPGNPPAVILLIDSSSSADDVEVPTGGTRWDAIVQSFTASGHPLEALQGQVAFGGFRYTGAPGMCPDTTPLAPALNNYSAISSFIGTIALTPATDTPTAEALTLASASLSSHSGDKYVIVVTDGIPDTCASNNGICVADAVDAAQKAYAAGVNTILVTIGGGFEVTPTDFKQSFANAGSGEPVATPPLEQSTYNCSAVTPTYAETGGNATFYEIADADIVAELGPTLAEIVGDIVGQ